MIPKGCVALPLSGVPCRRTDSMLDVMIMYAINTGESIYGFLTCFDCADLGSVGLLTGYASSTFLFIRLGN